MIRVQVHGANNHFRFFYKEHIEEYVSCGQPEHDTCPVCLSILRNGQKLWRLRRCEHVFHSECAKEWISRQPNCPLCRTTVHTPPRQNACNSMLSYQYDSSSEEESDNLFIMGEDE